MARDSRRRNGSNGRHEVPQSWLAGWFDPELEELFREEPELSRTARLLHASHPEAEANPHFRVRLRNSLLAEAERSRLHRRRWFLGPVQLAWSGVGVGVVAIAATVLALFNGPQPGHQTLVALSNVDAQHSVSPDDVITVSFNQPMNQTAVVAGLHIQPATDVTTAWRGNNLLITPVHHLTSNTPYTVTIDRSAAKTAAGSTAPSAIKIVFGTAPTLGPTASRPVPLALSTLGPISPGATVLFAPDGSVVVTSAETPAAPATPAQSTPTSTPTSNPSGTPSASASPVATAAAATSSLVEYRASDGTALVLGPAATAAAFSPDGSLLARAVPGSAGGSDLVVSSVSGSGQATLLHSDAEVSDLAWTTNQDIAFVSGANVIRSVDLTGVARTLSVPAGVASIQLDPNGRHAFLASSDGADGRLLDIGPGTERVLAGSGQSVAFSAAGGTVAWVDRSQSPARLETAQVAGGVPATVATPRGSIDTVALSPNGSEVAYVVHTVRGTSQTTIASLPSGSPVATGPAANGLAFSPDGRSVALISSSTGAPIVERARVPGTAQLTESGLPAAARTALQAFVEAQVQDDQAELAALSTPASGASAATPAGLSRGYVVSGAANSDGSISAAAVLIVDPTPSHTLPSRVDETLTLARSASGAFLVTGLSAGPIHDVVPGPHVLSVTTTNQHGSVVVQVNFDSDLQASSVPNAITVLSADGTVLTGAVSYDADTRSAAVTLTGAPSAPLTVSVATSLRDIDDQPLPTAFSTRASF